MFGTETGKRQRRLSVVLQVGCQNTRARPMAILKVVIAGPMSTG